MMPWSLLTCNDLAQRRISVSVRPAVPVYFGGVLTFYVNVYADALVASYDHTE